MSEKDVRVEPGHTTEGYRAAFDLIIAGVQARLSGAIGAILLVDDERVALTTGAAPSLPPEYVKAVNGLRIGPLAGSCGTAVYRGETVVVEDIEHDPLWEGFRDPARSHGLRACWSIPLKDANGVVFGTFTLYHCTPHRPGPAEIQIAQTAAELARLVVMGTRVEDALRESEARYALVVRGARAGIWDWDIRADSAYLSPRWKQLLGYEEHELANHVSTFYDHLHPEDAAPVQEAIRAHLEEGVPFDTELRLRHRDGTYRWFRSAGQAAWDDQREPVHMAGSMMDITGRKATEGALRQSEERLRWLSRQLLETQEAERRKIARDLHDHVGQDLSALKLTLASLQRHDEPSIRAALLTESIGITDQILGEVRTLSLNLHPSVLDDLGLAPAIEWCLERATSRTDVRVDYRYDMPLSKMDPAVKIACFRVLQEAVSNCMRHARASRLTVGLHCADGVLVLVCSDDGAGFEVDAISCDAAGLRGLGLLSMRERAELLGGRLTIRSTPGSGTEVRADFPLCMTQRPAARERAEV